MAKEGLKLYDIPRESKLLVTQEHGRNVFVTFHRLDGMYSYCTVDDGPDKGKTCHLSASTPLKKIEDHYEIDYTL